MVLFFNSIHLCPLLLDRLHFRSFRVAGREGGAKGLVKERGKEGRSMFTFWRHGGGWGGDELVWRTRGDFKVGTRTWNHL